MERYKLNDGGVIDVENNRSIPNDPDNRHWVEYQEWVGAGNKPDPAFTQEELDAEAIRDEVQMLRRDLKEALTWQFRMLLALFEVGKTKELWVNVDFDQELRQKAADWITKLNRLEELGE
jgi:hypothetical protein